MGSEMCIRDRLSDLLTIRKDVGRALKGKILCVIACSSDATVYEGFFLPFQRTAEYLNMRWGGGLHTWIEEQPLSHIPEQVKEELRNFGDWRLVHRSKSFL